MTILGKLRGEIKDQEKVPLPMNLNDEALLHHGSLIAVSFLLFFLRNRWGAVVVVVVVVSRCPCALPCPFPVLRPASHKFSKWVALREVAFLRSEFESESESEAQSGNLQPQQPRPAGYRFFARLEFPLSLHCFLWHCSSATPPGLSFPLQGLAPLGQSGGSAGPSCCCCMCSRVALTAGMEQPNLGFRAPISALCCSCWLALALWPRTVTSIGACTLWSKRHDQV